MGMDDQHSMEQAAEFRGTVLTKLNALEETNDKIVMHLETIFKRLGQGDVMFATVEANRTHLDDHKKRLAMLEAACMKCQERRKVIGGLVAAMIAAAGALGALAGHFIRK